MYSKTKEATVWSSDLGQMKWDKADAICNHMGMSLPTRNDFMDANRAGLTKTWSNKTMFHWTSEVAIWNYYNSAGTGHYLFAPYRGSSEAHPDSIDAQVRCIH